MTASAIGRPSIAQSAGRPLMIDDVLAITRIDRFAVAPDGDWAAAVLQRPANVGEAYGRTAYEVDPSRSDVWLISLRTGERRNITQGAEAAAGYWCAMWSPDGTRLAMLSTRPEGSEPRGGDNVRLYVWEAATGAVTRLSEAAVMTQTRYGSPLHSVDMRGGAGPGGVTHRCSDEENAPFLWLDDRRLLAVMLPPGGVSGLIDEYSRPARHTEQTLQALRDGNQPTLTVAGSGAERVPEAERATFAQLRLFDVEARAAASVAALPTYPFHGELTLSVAPDGRRAAVLATVGAIAPVADERSPYLNEGWLAERRLGFVTLDEAAPVRWVAMPAEGRYPLELLSWSPDSARVAVRARNSFGAAATPLFIASSDRLAVERVGPAAMSVGGRVVHSLYLRESPVFWVGDGSLLARVDGSVPGAGPADPPGEEWWLLRIGGEALNLTRSISGFPSVLRQAGPQQFFAVDNGRIFVLTDGAQGPQSRSLPLSIRAASIRWPADPRQTTSEVVIAGEAPDGGRTHQLISVANPAAGRRIALAPDAQLLAIEPARSIAISSQTSRQGVNVTLTSLLDGSRRSLLSTNAHLARIDWGETRLIEYHRRNGETSQAALILPPSYRPGRRYPVITWVYPAYTVRSLDSYFLDPYMPGFYNLYLYAAQGYVVLIPSIPPPATQESGLPDFSGDVLAAVDRLVDIGIADPERVGVMGQSFGGFGVYALVTQTNRFRAAVAMAGDTDFHRFYSQFDAAARGYDGIEHEKSVNWILAELGQIGLDVPPHQNAELYWRNSPQAYVDRVETPLLLIHGELDKRAPMSQAESFFYSLYRQGKTARLLRYWGESHSLAQSPANVRSIYGEIVAWFDRYLPPRPGPAGAD